MKKNLVLVLVNLLSVFGLFVFLELGVRWIMPELGPIGTERALIDEDVFNGRGGLGKQTSGISNGALITTDARRTIAYQKGYDEALPSVLFVGDSVTMGLGVEPDSTYAGLLSMAMDSMNVLNTALIGYNGTDYKAVVDSFLNRSSPLKEDRGKISQVVVFWCLNDVYKDDPMESIPGAATRKIGGGVLPFVRKHIRLYQVLKNAFFDRPRSYYEHDAFYYAPAGSYYRYAVKKLDEIRALCAEQGIALSVVLLPYEYQLRDHLPVDSLHAPQQLLTSDLEAIDIPVFDGLSHMVSREGSSKDLYLYGDGIHFSKRGHRAFAEFVLAEVF